MKHELRQMRKQGFGHIVNTSSDVGLGAMANFSTYCPSKAGSNILSACAASEGGAPEGGDASVNDVDDVACAVLWLCSDDASRINGNDVSVGGRLGIT